MSSMSARIRKVLPATALVAVLIAATATAALNSAASAQSEQDRIKQQVDEAERRVAAATSLVEAAQEEVDEAQQRVSEMQAKADAATQVYGDAHADTHVIEYEIEKVQDQIAAAEETVDSMRQEVLDITVSRYINSGQAPSLFNSEDTADQIFLDALARFVSEGNLDVVEDYRAALDDNELRQAQLADLLTRQTAKAEEARAAAEELQEFLSDLTAERNALAVKRDNQAGNLATLEADVRELNSQLQALIDEERRREAAAAAAAAQALLEQQRARRAAELSSVREANFGVVRSGPDWVCPVAGYFTHYKDWRAPRAYGGWHKGNDLFAERNTPLVSTESGMVTHRWNRVGGSSVHIRADSGNYYYYTHLESYENQGPPEGHWLEAGTVVGYMGNSGNAITTPVHLHFEFHRGGKGNYVNPYPYIRRNCFGE